MTPSCVEYLRAMSCGLARAMISPRAPNSIWPMSTRCAVNTARRSLASITRCLVSRSQRVPRVAPSKTRSVKHCCNLIRWHSPRPRLIERRNYCARCRWRTQWSSAIVPTCSRAKVASVMRCASLLEHSRWSPLPPRVITRACFLKRQRHCCCWERMPTHSSPPMRRSPPRAPRACMRNLCVDASCAPVH